MDEFTEKFSLRLKILTPLHITDGNVGELIPTDYVVSDDGSLHGIDTTKLFSQLTGKEAETLYNLIDQEDMIGIRNYIKSLWRKNSALFSGSIQYTMNAGDLKAFYDDLENENAANQLELKPFIRTAGKIYIPGSSLKGAIRTGILYGYLNKDGLRESLAKSRFELNRIANTIEAKALRYMVRKKNYHNKQQEFRWVIESTSDPLKSLKISDAFALVGESTVKKIWIAKKGKVPGESELTGEKGIKLFAECLEPGTQAELELRIDKRFFKSSKHTGRKIYLPFIVESCKAFYDKVLRHEKEEFFKNFDSCHENSKISDLYDEFLEINTRPDSFLIRLGRFNGRNSTSLNLINKKGKEPVSRSLIMSGGQFQPPGWACIQLV